MGDRVLPLRRGRELGDLPCDRVTGLHSGSGQGGRVRPPQCHRRPAVLPGGAQQHRGGRGGAGRPVPLPGQLYRPGERGIHPGGFHPVLHRLHPGRRQRGPDGHCRRHRPDRGGGPAPGGGGGGLWGALRPEPGRPLRGAQGQGYSQRELRRLLPPDRAGALGQ